MCHSLTPITKCGSYRFLVELSGTRYREQLKAWIAMSDVKDKRALEDANKRIEGEMARFKVHCDDDYKQAVYNIERQMGIFVLCTSYYAQYSVLQIRRK